MNIEIVERTAPTHHCLTVDITAGFLDVVECLFNRTLQTIEPDYTEVRVVLSQIQTFISHLKSPIFIILLNARVFNPMQKVGKGYTGVI